MCVASRLSLRNGCTLRSIARLPSQKRLRVGQGPPRGGEVARPPVAEAATSLVLVPPAAEQPFAVQLRVTHIAATGGSACKVAVSANAMNFDDIVAVLLRGVSDRPRTRGRIWPMLQRGIAHGRMVAQIEAKEVRSGSCKAQCVQRHLSPGVSAMGRHEGGAAFVGHAAGYG